MNSDDQDSRENRDSESPSVGGPPDADGSNTDPPETGGDRPLGSAEGAEAGEGTESSTPEPGEGDTPSAARSPTESSIEPVDESSDDATPPSPGGSGGGDDGGSDDPPDEEGEPHAVVSAEAPDTKAKSSEESGESPPTATYYDDPYDDHELNYGESSPDSETTAVAEAQPGPDKTPPPTPPPPSAPEDDSDDDEEGMTRMSFLQHLEELRTRILHSLAGLVVTYAFSLVFKNQLFQWMRGPFDRAVENMPPDLNVQLVAITPIEQFHLLWLKVPLVAAIFLATPWLGYQAWAFVAPGLYKRERRWAAPFIFCTSALFLLGGAFGYYIALRFALEFLLSVGQEVDIQSMISVNAYYGTFVSIMLGLGVVFQLPVVIFMLTALRITSPGFLLTNVRYAILIIFVLAAVITPTPDIFNMILFAMPMILLFFVGIGASYLFVQYREKRRLPWEKIMVILIAVGLTVLAGVVYYMQSRLGYQFVSDFPWFIKP